MNGHARQRSNGKWEYSIPLEKGTDGKRKRITGGGFVSEEEAEKAMVAALHELNTGEYSKPVNAKVKEFMIFWLSLKESEISYATYRTYKHLVYNYINKYLGDAQLPKLSILEIQIMYKTIEKTVSKSMVKKVHQVLVQALNYAIDIKSIKENPALKCKLPRLEKKEFGFWGAKQLMEFLHNAKSSKYYPAYLITIYSGLRMGEILSLRWGNIDFEQNKISIKNSITRRNPNIDNSDKKTSHSISFDVGKTKTKNSVRTIGLPSFVMDELRIWKDKRFVEDERTFNLSSDFVIRTRSGNYILPRNFSRDWYRLLDIGKLPRIRFHDIRHSHATLLLGEKVPIKAISERLGHGSTAITMEIYSHVTEQMEDEVIEALNLLTS